MLSASYGRSLSPRIAPLQNHSHSLGAADLFALPLSAQPLSTPVVLAHVISGPHSDTVAYLWQLWERSCNPHERAHFIAHLGRQSQSLPYLQKLIPLRLSEPERLALIQALATHADPQANRELQRLYQVSLKGSRQQLEVILALGRSQSPEAIRFLEQIYTQAWHQPAYREQIIRALGLHSSAEAIALLVGYSQRNSTDFKLQRQIIEALGHSQSAASAQVLNHFLGRYSQHPEMRQHIYRALSATGSDTALEHLRHQLKHHTCPNERHQIQQALNNLYADDTI